MYNGRFIYERRKETQSAAVFALTAAHHPIRCGMYPLKDGRTYDRSFCKLDFYLSFLQSLPHFL